MNIDGKSCFKLLSIERIKDIGLVGFSQVVIQLISFLSGILIVRTLPTQEYAYFTLAYSILGAMNALADGGVSAGIFSEGGKVWRDPVLLGRVYATGLAVRSKLGIFCAVVLGALLECLLLKNGATLLYSICITISILLTFWIILSGFLIGLVLQLHQKLKELQSISILQNLTRLGLLSAFLIFSPFTLSAIICALLPLIWATFKTKKIASDYADLNQCEDSETKFKIIALVKRSLPSNLYFCIQGQITVMMVSFFGSVVTLAQIGALGRIGQIMMVFTSISIVVIAPRFARLNATNWELLKYFYLVLSATSVFGLLVLAGVLVAPQFFLLIIGSDYAGLSSELLLLTIGSVLNLVAGIAYGLASARGYFVKPIYMIPLLLAAQVILVFCLDMGSLKGVLMMSIGMGLMQLTINLFFYTRFLMHVSGSKLIE